MIRFRLLSCQIEIEHEDPRLAQALAYLTNAARQPGEVRRRVVYAVTGRSPYRIHEAGDLVAVVERPDDVLYVLFGRIHQRVLERFVLASWSVLHGGVVELEATAGPCRLLLLGDKGAGKTTLAASLLTTRHRVEGDELALERRGQVLAFPRRLHLKPGIERHVPELASRLEDLPRAASGEQIVRGLDPTSLGVEWTVRSAPIDHVVHLEPNHGGTTELSPLAPFEAIQCVTESFRDGRRPRGDLVASALRLGARGGHRLTVGDPRSAIRALEGLRLS